MSKTTYLSIILLIFSTQAFSVADCETAKRSETFHLIKTAHTIVYTLPELCKPQLISDFSAIKNDGSDIYNLNWSKQDHDLWHVSRYEVRVDATDVTTYDSSVVLPVAIDLSSQTTNIGMADFEVRACASITQTGGSTIESCGDWQTTITQCETDCTDQTLDPPLLAVPIGNNTTGEYDVSWVGAYNRYVLQERAGLLGNWVTIQDDASLSRHFINQANGSINTYRVKGCFGTVCSPDSRDQTVTVRFTPDIPNLSITTQTTTDGIYSVNWSASNFANKYELQEQTDNGNFITIQNTSALSKSFNKTSNHIFTYQVRACNVDECSNYSNSIQVLVDLPINPAAPAVFDVYQDLNTQRRFLTWQGNSSNNGLGITSYKIKAYDNINDVVFERQVAIDYPQPFVLNSLQPNKYTLSECTNNTCGDERQDTLFDQGLSRVIDLAVNWVTIDPNNNQFKLEFNYPAELITNNINGNPTEFKVYSDLGATSGNNLIDTIAIGSGNVINGWQSKVITLNSTTGNSFKVFACNQVLSCGVVSDISVGAPLTSADLIKPTELTVSTGIASLTLRWQIIEGVGGVADIESIDYFEITEKQPTIRAHTVYSNNLNRALFEKMYYIDVKDVIDEANGGYTFKLKRQNRGEYKYKLRSCNRDREFGDVCSTIPNPDSWKVVELNRVTVSDIVLSNNKVSMPTSLGWYEFIKDSQTNYALNWQYEHTALNYTPDYFYITLADEEGVNNCGIKQYTVNYADKVTFSGVNTWTTEVDCADLGEHSEWQVQACINGVGCSPYSETIEVGVVAQQSNNTSTDGLLSSSQGTIGGPGDFNPGLWWHPELEGTGWHFYWASDLRYDSDDPKYKNTYDLIGYWFAYREIRGVWTPTWFEARLKQVIDGGATGGGYFEGDIFYHRKTNTDLDKIDAGHIQLNFGNTNQTAELVISPNYTGGLFTAISSAEDISPFTSSGNKLKLQIEDFAVENVGGPENDADHYTGLWQHFDATNNPDLSLLTWIERGVEVSTIATFDTDNKPIWLQLQSDCNDVSCLPTGSYFDDYIEGSNVDGTITNLTVGIVHNGFNPLAAKPLAHDFGGVDGSFVNYHGKFGRCLGSGVDNFRFRDGMFWLDITENLIYPDADGGTYTRSISDFGLNSASCNASTTGSLTKLASLHDIRYFINDQDEFDSECDPNDITGSGECVITFNWYTDDYFPSIEPYYSLNGSTYSKLNNICPGITQGNDVFVNTGFSCTLAEPGIYSFQLHKNKYNTANQTTVIAESRDLQILSCTSDFCNPPVGDPAMAPGPTQFLNDIIPDPENSLVGTTSGVFDIDESGSANYSIPIFAPVGRGGLAPQMALRYNSNASNGIAGVGWNISGISSITRCLKSSEHDPGMVFYPPIQLDNSDALCMDGQRLFKLADGSYRTEIDSFSEIKAIGATGNGPTKFKVRTKSGEIRVYGSPNAAFKANKVFLTNGTGAQVISNDGDTVHTWLLNKIEDRNGNQTHFVWDTLDGESYLSQVKWTISDSDANNHYQIDFEYTGSRSDAMHHYGIGTEYKAYRNLTHISTLIRQAPATTAFMQEVRRLKLNYETSSNPTGMLRLASVEQCLNSGTCLQPVEFEWDNNNTQTGFGGSSFASGNDIQELKEMGFGSFKPIDINGDGAMELIFVRGYDDANFFLLTDPEARYWVAYHVEGSDPQAPHGGTCHFIGSASGQDTSYYNYVCDTGIKPFNADGAFADEFNPEKWFVLDYNGDGFQDILSPVDTIAGNDNNDNWHVFLSNGQEICEFNCGTAYEPVDTQIVFYSRKGGSSLLDYTADGLPDLMTFDIDSSSGSDLYKYKLYPMVKDYTGTNFAGYKFSTTGQFVDIDTDKLVPSDMFCSYDYVDPNTNIHETRESKCISVPTSVDYAGGILAGKLEITASDFNGDGYNDAIFQYRYLYGPEACGLPSPDPLSPTNGSSFPSIPIGEYSAEPLIETTTNQATSIERCEQKFKVAMLFNKDPVTGVIEFQYAGRLGVISTNHDHSSNNHDLQLTGTYCEYGDLQECLGDINGKIGASRIIDINGDGMADFSYLSPDNDYKYKLNLAKTVSTTVAEVIVSDVTIPAYTYDKLVFSEIKSLGLPPIVTEQICETNNHDSNFLDNDACGRRFLVQYLDYDMDGDVDFMYPALESATSSVVKYKLKTYQKLANGNFGYQDFAIQNSQQITSYLTTEEPQTYSNLTLDFDGDGNPDHMSLLRNINTQKLTVNLASNSWHNANKITAITNRLDTKETDILISYNAMTDPNLETLYTKSTNSLITIDRLSPVFDILAPSYLVSEVSKSSPTLALPDALTTLVYNYAGLKVQGGGRGSLGFASINSYDPHHDITTITEYIQAFPYIGMPKSTKSYLGEVTSTNLLSESFSFYLTNETDIGLGHTTYFPYLNNSIEKEYALNVTYDNNNLPIFTIDNNTPQNTIINEFTYNVTDILHGNLSTSTSASCSGDANSMANCAAIEKKESLNDYSDDEANWLLGRLKSIKVTSTRNGQSKIKTSEFDYHPTTGQLTEERIIGDNSNNQFLRTVHVYDGYGQEIETYQCSKHLSTTSSCATPPVEGRNTTDNTYIHRYNKVVYDSQWDEYIARKVEPFTSFVGFELSTTFTLPNDLVEGTVIEKDTLKVFDLNGQRDIYGNPIFGNDVFGTQVHTYYDDFGQVYATTSNLGSKSVTTRKWCSQTDTFCPDNGNIIVETQTQGSATIRTYSDVLGREIRSQSQMFTFGQWTTVDTFYDQRGNTVKQTEPYVRTNTSTSVGSTFTTTNYDPLDRILVITSPSHCMEDINVDFQSQNCIDEDVITYTSYDGLSVSTTNPNGQDKTQIFDESGKVISSIDPHGKSVIYSYEANGNLSITTSHIDTTGADIPITMSYDSLGRKTGMIDPDKGTWSYQYNALGELITQTDAKGQTSNNYYDIRGRLYYREQPNVNSIWEYDLQANWGQLVNEYSVGGYISRGLAQIKNNSFDAYHRPNATVTTVYDGFSNQAPSYVTSQTYDEYGRLFQSFDATGNGVLYQYNIRGFQETIRDAADDEFGQIYYQVLNTNARGQILHEKFYNKFETTKTYENSTGFLSRIISTNALNDEVQHLEYAFDKIGNLVRRSDLTPINNIVPDDVWSETFEYDSQNRLLTEFLNYANNPENSYSYDESGNLLTKVNNTEGLSTYTYPQNAIRPHGVTNVTNTTTNKHNDYTYDNNGNVTLRDGTEHTVFVYTSFDKPETMISTNGWLAEIAYNAGRNRYLRIDDSGSSGKTITHYLGSVEYIYKDGLTKAKRYIGNLVINIDNDTSNRNLWKFNYLLKDHIGSTHTIVDKAGDTVTHMSFNAWGARRQAAVTGSLVLPVYKDYDLFQVWSVMGNSIESTTNRGFTGHEHFDQLGIIHMNGRIYDPSIGRFLQADPIIQDPYDTQSLNRYSYVMNNPLSYTDPTGYARLNSGAFRQIVAIAVMFIPGAQGIGMVFLQGALSGAIATGSLKGALKGGLQAAVTFGIAHGGANGAGWIKAGKGFDYARTAAHAVVGGISAELDGGKFGHGFASSVLTSGVDKMFNGGIRGGFRVRIVANAIVAGTISELTGGKFANGAMSAAFRVAFNDAYNSVWPPRDDVDIPDIAAGVKRMSDIGDNLLGPATVLGGVGQVGLGAAICDFSLGIGCGLGAIFASYGINNIYEGAHQTFGSSASGPVRELWRAGLGQETGDLAYLATDFALSTYGFFRSVKVPADFSSYTITRNPNRIIPKTPSYYRPAYHGLSGVEGGVDVVNYLNSIYSINNEVD